MDVPDIGPLTWQDDLYDDGTARVSLWSGPGGTWATAVVAVCEDHEIMACTGPLDGGTRRQLVAAPTRWRRTFAPYGWLLLVVPDVGEAVDVVGQVDAAPLAA